MEDEVREKIRNIVEDEDANLIVIGRHSLERKQLLSAILERRQSLEDVAVMEDYRDWRRAVDGEFDAIVIPKIVNATDKRQGDVLEGVRDGLWVVAAGIEDLQDAIDSGELREDLYDELDPMVLDATALLGSWYEDTDIEAMLDEALVPEAERPSSLAPDLPSDLDEWCGRAGIEPVDTRRHDHLEEGELWTIEVDASEVEEPWRRLMSERAGTGYYPLVTGAKDPVTNRRGNVESLLENYHPNQFLADRDRSMEQWLAEARRVDVDDWVQAEIDRYRADSLGAEFFESDAVTSTDASGFSDPEFTGRTSGTFAISLVPVDAGWKVPAFFHYGGFVPNPTPDLHGAVLKRWTERWGARPCSLTVDTMELYVEEPIRQAEGALQVAREYLVYGSAEGYYDTIGDLAEAIYGSEWMSFYFDTI